MAYNDWLAFNDPNMLARYANRGQRSLFDRATEEEQNPLGVGTATGPQFTPPFNPMSDIPEGIGKPKTKWDKLRQVMHVGLFPMGNPNDPEGAAAARSQALIAAGAGLLSGKNFGEAMLIGQQAQQEGLRQGGTLAYMSAQQKAMEQEAEREKTKLELDARLRAKADAIANDPKYGGDPEQISRAMILSGDPELIELGAKQMSTYKQQVELYGNLPAGMRRLDLNPQAPWAFDPAYLEGETRLKAAGAPRMSSNYYNETEYGKTRGKATGDRMNMFVDNIDKGRARLATFDTAANLLDSGLDTGWAEGELLVARRLASTFGEAFGVDMGDVDEKSSKQEFFRSLANQMALQLRNPAGGEGMPGQLSNRDLIFLQQSTIGLEKTEAGNRKIIEYGRKLAQRQIEVGQMAQQWERQNGRIDAPDAQGRYFDDAVRDYAESHNLFPEPGRGAEGNWGPPGGVEDRVRNNYLKPPGSR